jgi:hypothetical protein
MMYSSLAAGANGFAALFTDAALKRSVGRRLRPHETQSG